MYFHTQKKQTLLQVREDVCSRSGGRAKPLQIPQGGGRYGFRPPRCLGNAPGCFYSSPEPMEHDASRVVFRLGHENSVVFFLFSARKAHVSCGHVAPDLVSPACRPRPLCHLRVVQVTPQDAPFSRNTPSQLL